MSGAIANCYDDDDDDDYYTAAIIDCTANMSTKVDTAKAVRVQLQCLNSLDTALCSGCNWQLHAICPLSIRELGDRIFHLLKHRSVRATRR